MSTPPNQLPTPQPSGLSTEDIRNMVQNFMSKGETESKVATLLSENFQYREKVRGLTEQVSQLSAKVPADGTLVLAGEELKTYNEFLALKLKPAEVTTLQGEMTRLKGEVEGAKRTVSLTAAAAAEGYDATVLGTLVGDKELVVKPVEEDVDGEKKKVERAFILTKGADNVVTEERLSTHITEKHSKFLPSLMVAEGDDTGTSGSSGTAFPRQRASTGGKTTPKDASKAYIDRKYKSPPAQGAGK